MRGCYDLAVQKGYERGNGLSGAAFGTSDPSSQTMRATGGAARYGT